MKKLIYEGFWEAVPRIKAIYEYALLALAVGSLVCSVSKLF
jgi:hypothetical protein